MQTLARAIVSRATTVPTRRIQKKGYGNWKVLDMESRTIASTSPFREQKGKTEKINKKTLLLNK